MRKRALQLLLIVFSLFSLSIQGQEVKFKSLYLYNFTKYVGWPPEAKTGDFVIGILGSNTIFNMVDQIATGKMVGSQKITVVKFNKAEEIANCHILFVGYGRANSSGMAEVMEKVGTNNTLVVSERDGATKDGAAINFVIRNEEMKFELHKLNALNHKLQISSNLEKLAILVD